MGYAALHEEHHKHVFIWIAVPALAKLMQKPAPMKKQPLTDHADHAMPMTPMNVNGYIASHAAWPDPGSCRYSSNYIQLHGC